MRKFSSKMDDEVLTALRLYADESGQSLAHVITEAVRLYLDQKRIRPVFQHAKETIFDAHDELLQRLAK